MVVVPSHWEKWMFLLYTMVVVMRAHINPAAIVLRHLLPELEFTSFCSLADTNLVFVSVLQTHVSYHLFGNGSDPYFFHS